jgi:NAD(P)-dependent dehydrogenase (short-subunit alcohol dehydrogenase family)
MENLKNKVALVTGARRGMGKSHAIALAKQGAKVVVTDINQAECQAVVDEIKNFNGEAIAFKLDVANKSEIDSVVAEIVKKYGQLDILINNAGIVQFKPFLELSEEDWDKTIDINLKGEFLCAQAAAKVMKEKGGGVIVNIASVAMGQQGIGMPNIVHYCASKGGIAGMTEAMAAELAPFNIRVNAVAPGMIDTPMVDVVKADPKMTEGMLQRVPLKRFGRSEEVSELVVFLASDSSSYMTGSVVIIDGGWLAT